ncbi:MAG: hypothetical protein EPO12_12415 [Aquabacterium sp.]|nr:MAG: hypothetical protein EPO12_12415 [Aquabacterium sp.]
MTPSLRHGSALLLVPLLALLATLAGCDPAGTTALLVRRGPPVVGHASVDTARLSMINGFLIDRGFEPSGGDPAAASGAAAERRWSWTRASRDDSGGFSTIVRVEPVGADLRIILSDFPRLRTSAPTRALAAELAAAIGAAKDVQMVVEE